MADKPDIISAIHKHRMFRKGDSVVVAVSGGPDSVAMLHALHTRSGEIGITLHVAHLNHGIRDRESDSDEEFVWNLAHGCGLPITVERVDVPALRTQMRVGEEEAARAARYKFLRETAAKLGANRIAVGHTADDRVESVLLNIIRGCGSDGLASIAPVQGMIVRPMIETWRRDIEEYLRENGLSYRVDATNLDTSRARNRVRHELLPLLGEHYNPRVKEALLRLADIASRQNELMGEIARSAISGITLGGSMDTGLFALLPEALQYEILRAEISRLKGDLVDVTMEQVERIVSSLRQEADFRITLPSGRLYATRKRNRFWIGERKPAPRVEPFEHALNVPGRTLISQIDLAIDAEVIERPEGGPLPGNAVLIDCAAIRGELRIRNVRSGDTVVPFGMSGSKKLQDVFVDAGIPAAERARAAVVADDERILWVVGVVASEAGRVTAATSRAIRLSAVRGQ